MEDDIVERLRTSSDWSDAIPTMEEAADEITRLRAENEKLREALEGMIDLAEAANVMEDPAYDAARKALENGDE